MIALRKLHHHENEGASSLLARTPPAFERCYKFPSPLHTCTNIRWSRCSHRLCCNNHQLTATFSCGASPPCKAQALTPRSGPPSGKSPFIPWRTFPNLPLCCLPLLDISSPLFMQWLDFSIISDPQSPVFVTTNHHQSYACLLSDVTDALLYWQQHNIAHAALSTTFRPPGHRRRTVSGIRDLPGLVHCIIGIDFRFIVLDHRTGSMATVHQAYKGASLLPFAPVEGKIEVRSDMSRYNGARSWDRGGP